MKVLVVPFPGEVEMKPDDFCTAKAGSLLSIYGEPCHEGEEEINRHGCGRVFLAIEEDGGLCTNGVVREMTSEEVKSRLERSVFVSKTMKDLGEGEGANMSPEAEGARGMLAGFTAVVMEDLRGIADSLTKVPSGSVFGVRNTGSGSRLVYRAWGERKTREV